jgi:hypothetical protein
VALTDRLDASSGIDHTLTLWRHETLAATLRFLDVAVPPA